MSVLCLIQARLASARLPRKILAGIGGLTALEHVYRRATAALPAVFIMVAVPYRDEPELRRWTGLPLFPWGGEENDVLGRFAGAARAYGGDIVVRLTADCPFVDPGGIRAVVAAVEAGADYAYLDPVPNGLDAEAFTGDLLQRVHREATDPYDREHVTSYMRRHARHTIPELLGERWPDEVNVLAVPLFADLPRYCWTLDTPADLQFFQEVAREIDCTPPHPTVPELLALMERRPDLVRLEP